MKGGDKNQNQMKKLLLTAVTMIMGMTAFSQMGPFHGFVEPPNNSGYAASAEIRNGTCYVRCYTKPNSTCVKTLCGMGKPAVDIIDSNGKSVLRIAYSKGQYRTDPKAQQAEYQFFDAVKL